MSCQCKKNSLSAVALVQKLFLSAATSTGFHSWLRSHFRRQDVLRINSMPIQAWLELWHLQPSIRKESNCAWTSSLNWVKWSLGTELEMYFSRRFPKFKQCCMGEVKGGPSGTSGHDRSKQTSRHDIFEPCNYQWVIASNPTIEDILAHLLLFF